MQGALLTTFAPGDNLHKVCVVSFIHSFNDLTTMLVTSCSQNREIKVWQCGVTRDGKYEVNLFRSFDVNSYCSVVDIDAGDEGAVLMIGSWECTTNFDGTKIILAVQLTYMYMVDETMLQRGSISTIDVDSGHGTEFILQPLVDACIGGLTASQVDNKFAVIFDRWIYIWDIDAGPDVPLHRFPATLTNFSSFSFSNVLALNTTENLLVRGLYKDIVSYAVEDGSEINRVSMPIVRAISVSLHLQRIAAVSKSLVTIFHLQSWTKLIAWGIDRPSYERDLGCYFLQFCSGSTDLLTSHPVTRTVFIWNSVSGEMVREIDNLFHLQSYSVRWWDVGRIMLACGESDMKILDSSTAEELCCWKAHDSTAQPVGGFPQSNILL
jgi:hypothetical protein